MQGYAACLISAQGDGSPLTNSTTPTSILPGQAKYTMGAGFIDGPTRAFRVYAKGRISTVVTSPGTLTLDLRLGSVVVANGGAMTLSTTAKTNVSWEVEWTLQCRAVGPSTSANFMHVGRFTSEAAGATTVAGEAKSLLLPASAPAVGTGFDSTAAQTWDMFATWQTASSSNSITLHLFELWSSN